MPAPKRRALGGEGQGYRHERSGGQHVRSPRTPMARFGDEYGYDLVELSHSIDSLDAGGRWAVMIPFPVYRYSLVSRLGKVKRGKQRSVLGPGSILQHGPAQWTARCMSGPLRAPERKFRQETSTKRIFAGFDQMVVIKIRTLWPLTLCWPQGKSRAPYAGAIRIPEIGVHIACASPELYLARSGSTLTSKPIKGTATSADGLLEKDRAENIMIVDLVRNDLSRCCIVGSVKAVDLLEVQQHPGLVHLVSTVQGEISPHAGWTEIVEATFPPGSITGAPKIAALDIIQFLEPEDRGPYCGAFGWIDSDTQTASLAVAIRTFWLNGDLLKFGTGAGITWGSNPQHEWEETQLKARHLATIAEQSWMQS